MEVLGNMRLLDSRSAVILNSSQSKTPCGNDPWIKGTAAAIKRLIESGHVIITSIGLNTWEMAVYMTAEYGGKQIIISHDVPDAGCKSVFEETIRQFRLDDARIAMAFLNLGRPGNKPKANWSERDRTAVETADVIVPVSISGRGKLARLIEKSRGEKEIDPSHLMGRHTSIVSSPKYSKERIIFDEPTWDYIVHWTRTCHGPWPGQTKCSYYERILNSKDSYPNNAFETLMNIAREKKIRASSKRIRKSLSVTAFSQADPRETLGSLRWLPKRTCWNFEPYGVAIRREAAAHLGIRPVIYGDSRDYDALPSHDRPFFQSRGSRNVDWRDEKEWRRIGDLDLSAIAGENLAFIVWRKSEIPLMEQIFHGRVIAAGPDS